VTRHICYVTGTRADFGLIAFTLNAIRKDPRFVLSTIVTGSHLSERYGMTVAEVERLGVRIAAKIPVDLNDTTGAQMARNIGTMLIGFVDALEELAPDLVLLLGDRGEMLAGAVAASHLSIPVVHIHGGERSGTIDESVRHAISKLATHHLVATRASGLRLERMGEDAHRIVVTGAPGLDGIQQLAEFSRVDLSRRCGFKVDHPIVLFVFHPVLYESDSSRAQTEACVSAMQSLGLQVVALLPNSDAGSNEIRRALLEAQQSGRFITYPHLARAEFVSWMACCDVMVGNSSSGILEAASFGTPVVNVGSRQRHRERSGNVIDCAADSTSVRDAIALALARGRFPVNNVYGDGATAARIVSFLSGVDLAPDIVAKCNAY
jgi:GDP/UDP-N,N'-diacetylbacillosamine 2-epimerase (hydrolysing)